MKASFPVVGEKEYKASTLRTEQRQCGFPPRIESIFISFVSFSFNKRHVSVPTRTSIRVIDEIRVPNKFVLFELFVFKITRVQNPLSEICVQYIFV